MTSILRKQVTLAFELPLTLVGWRATFLIYARKPPTLIGRLQFLSRLTSRETTWHW